MTSVLEIQKLSDVQLGIEARLGQTTMTLRELLDLVPDHTIKLAKPAGENIDVLVGGSLICSGEVIFINEMVGIRVTEFREED